MKRFKKLRHLLAVGLLAVCMLNFSGCIIIVSDRLVEEGVETVGSAVEEIKEQGIFLDYTRASLVYKIVSEEELTVLGRESNGRKIIIEEEFEGYPITQITEWAFHNTDIRTVEIGENIYQIGTKAFWNCDNLEKATFKNFDGWYVDGEKVAEEDLKDKEKAAELLKEGGEWLRKW